MRFKISLTTRLSLIFSAVMLTVWWLSSFILISTLNGYFDNQDRDFLTGKLQLTEEFLKTETFRNKTDIKSLSEKINDAMVGHNGLFISIKNMENEKIVELYAKNSVVPAVLLNKSGDILDYMIQTEENNTVYRSISRRVAVTPEQGKSKHVIITVATDTGYHTLFMDKLSTWLFWFNIGLVFISVFLGWLTTRIGLKPLREMTSLASSMTVHSLDQRLNPDLAPPEISETMQEFNNMFDRLEGAFRKLSDFSSDIAHELRTPVSNLMMQTQFALAKERDVSHYREILFANLMPEPGWGRITDSHQWNTLLSLHNAQFYLLQRTPEVARSRATPLLDLIKTALTPHPPQKQASDAPLTRLIRPTG